MRSLRSSYKLKGELRCRRSCVRDSANLEFDLERRSFDAGADRQVTFVIGDPNSQTALLLDEPLSAKKNRIDAQAPNFTDRGFEPFSGSNFDWDVEYEV